jgi:Flagellar hook-length control protein FliK
MYPAKALSQILAVQPTLDAIERDHAAPRAAFEYLKIGQMLTALVKSQAKGVSLVEIEGQTVAMRLPSPAAVGDTLHLRFAGNMPQTVFLLEAPQRAPTDKPQLSQTARMLSDIMLRVPERSLPTLTPPGPLLDQPTASPADMALALRTALVRSGLFYESHLANWTVGLDSLEGLMQEPQNRQAADAARAPASAVTTLALMSTSEPAEPKAANPMHTLLTQQLQVLESPHFIWRGELWPGQMLEWQISRETDPHADESAAVPAQAEEAGWESRLKLTLPQLGTVDVHIKLDARQAFSIRMVPEQAEVEPLLQQNLGRLIEQLAAAGCALQTFTVQHDAGA